MRMIYVALLLLISSSAIAYDSGIAIQTDRGASLQVIVNGKVYNKQPSKFVRVRSTPGLFHLEIKVLNPWNKQWYVVKKNVQIEKGFEFQYKVVFVNRLKPELVAIKKYPIYSRYFLNPQLYNRHPIS